MFKLAPRFKQTISAAAALRTLCFPSNFTFIFLIIFFVFVLSLKLKSNVVLSKLYLIFFTRKSAFLFSPYVIIFLFLILFKIFFILLLSKQIIDFPVGGVLFINSIKDFSKFF